MIPTERLYAALACVIGIYCLGYLSPALLQLGVLANVIIAAVVLGDWYVSPSGKKIKALRAVAERLSIGRANLVIIEIFNQARAGEDGQLDQGLLMRLRDDYPLALAIDTSEFEFRLKPQSRVELSYKLTPDTRGQYQFGNINLRFASKLGFFWRQLVVAQPQSVKVYPDLVALKDLSIKLAQSSELGNMRLRKRGQGTDFASLREYVSGDDTRKVDWKATARRERPVVRMYEVEREQTMMVLVDAGRMMVSDLEGLRRFDHALNAALSLVLTGLARGDQVGLGIFAERPLVYMPPRRGKAYLPKVLEAVCDVQPKMVEPDYVGALSYFAEAHKQRALMVVLTDLTDPTGSQTLLSGLASLSPRHLPFCVTLADRQLSQLALAPAPGVPAAGTGADMVPTFKRAVAADLLVQRELAFSHLIRRGCLVLDCPPQDLSEKLVDRYLEIKARGRL